ncbi:hypothetical protein JCM5350_001027 [Sporobolomyces pararoseus]
MKKYHPKLHEVHENARNSAGSKFLRECPWGSSAEISGLVERALVESYTNVFGRGVEPSGQQLGILNNSVSQRLITLRSSIRDKIQTGVEKFYSNQLASLAEDERDDYLAGLASSDDGFYFFHYKRWEGPNKKGKSGAFLHPSIAGAIQLAVFSHRKDFGYVNDLFPDSKVTKPFIAFICTAILHGLRVLKDSYDASDDTQQEFSLARYRHHYNNLLAQITTREGEGKLPSTPEYFSELFRTASWRWRRREEPADRMRIQDRADSESDGE